MGLWMDGTVSAEDQKILASPYISFHPLPGYEEDEETGVNDEKGERGLGEAVGLWQLIGSDKAVRLRRLLDEIRVEDNLVEDKGYRVSVEQVARAAELLDGLEDAMQEYVDEEWNIRPEKLEYIRQRDPDLIEKSQEANGRIRYEITRPLWYATWAARFLKVAARLRREVWLG